MKKYLIYTALSICLLGATLQAQMQQGQEPSSSFLMTVSPWRASGIPSGWQPRRDGQWQHVCGGASSRPRVDVQYNPLDADSWGSDHAEDGAQAKTAHTSSLGMGRSFVANNFTLGAPADNAMAISNSGFIVSADNTTIDYYSDGPDTLVQFQYHATFYGDTLLGHVPFDPRVIYDRYADRFIVVMALNTISTTSQLLVSFSKSDDPRDGWNHYRIKADTLDEGQWMDFPQIAINKEELFITGNMVGDVSFVPEGNKVFQIRKSEGYDSLALVLKVWPDIMDADSGVAIFLCPLSDGLMSDAYRQGIYLASTEKLSSTQTGNRLYWYHLRDSIGAAAATVESYKLSAGVPYQPQMVGLQLGSSDYLDLGNSRVQSGFHLGGKLYFVYCKNTNGYCTVVLNRVETTTNTLERNGWGFSSGAQDDAFPAIAFTGRDSSEAGKLMMCFQRSGSNIFAQMRAVCFDSVFAPNSLLVRDGDGYIDNDTSVFLERFGDYTTIQRRYGAANPACWAMASYPVGASGNFFNNYNGYNAFIAEFTDSVSNSFQDASPLPSKIEVFPNPCSRHVNVRLRDAGMKIVEIQLIGMEGKVFQNWHQSLGNTLIGLDLLEVPVGWYVLDVKLKNESHEYFKLQID